MLLFNDGKNIKMISQRLDHADVGITLSVYVTGFPFVPVCHRTSASRRRPFPADPPSAEEKFRAFVRVLRASDCHFDQ
jgi:hypothetical protein